MLVWKSLLRLPTTFADVDWIAAVGIVAMVASSSTAGSTVLGLSGPAEWLNWLFVFVPMVTGYLMTHHLFFPYEVLFSLHMLSVDLLLIWIPFSRISHFMFYFFSRTIHGVEFGKRGVRP
jgi:hypothetical protein